MRRLRFLVPAILVVLLAVVLSLRGVHADAPYGPAIVARVSSTGLTGGVAATTLWTPTTNDFYEIFIDLEPTTTWGTCSISPYLHWTDTTGTARSVNAFSTVVQASSSGPIQYEARYGGGTCSYNLNAEAVKE